MLQATRCSTKTIVETIIRDFGPVEKIILFGSAARGEMDESSDIDLIIVKKTALSFVRRMVEAPVFPVHTDIFVYTPEEFRHMQENENPFLISALKHGIVLYERG